MQNILRRVSAVLVLVMVSACATAPTDLAKKIDHEGNWFFGHRYSQAGNYLDPWDMEAKLATEAESKPFVEKSRTWRYVGYGAAAVGIGLCVGSIVALPGYTGSGSYTTSYALLGGALATLIFENVALGISREAMADAAETHNRKFHALLDDRGVGLAVSWGL